MVHGVLNNVFLEHSGLPFIFPIKVHLDFGHHCNTQWYLRLLSGEYFKERGEQYGAVWVNIVPVPFGSLIAKFP